MPISGNNLPIASTTILGGIKVGTNLTIAGDGTLSATGGTLPIASPTVLGGVKIGNNITEAGDGKISIDSLTDITLIETELPIDEDAVITASTQGPYTDIYVGTRVTQTETLFNNIAVLSAISTTAGKSYKVTVDLIARRDSGSAGAAGDTYGAVMSAIYKNVAGTLTLVGSVSYSNYFLPTVAPETSLYFSTSGNDLSVNVFGINNTTIFWNAEITTSII